jgi:6,7-dimethyl-8-ribityllumazine synthase
MSGAAPCPRVAGEAARDARYVLLASRFNAELVEAMVKGARTALHEAGVDAERIELLRVPGAFELPQAAARVIAAGRADAVIAIGVVIRGETPHFDFVADSCCRGLVDVGLRTGVPVLLGVLTTETRTQAEQRASVERDNKGAEVARAALEMVDLYAELGAAR